MASLKDSGQAIGVRTGRGFGGKINIELLAQSLSKDAAKRAEVLDAPASVYMYDSNAPRVRWRRATVRREFLLVISAILKAEGTITQDATDEEVEAYAYDSTRFINYTVSYLFAIASCESTNRGLISDKIKTSTLRSRVYALWWTAMWKLGPLAGSVYPSFTQYTDAAVHKASVDNDLGTACWEKYYFGVPELRLLFDALMSQSRGIEWYKQHYAAWAVTLMTGARPGSLAVAKGYKAEEQCLRWQDIRFLRFHDGRPGLFLEITIRWLKGHRDPRLDKNKNFRPVVFMVQPCKLSHNLVADLTWILPALALERGLFGDRKWSEIEMDTASVIGQIPHISRQPVFLQAGAAYTLTQNGTPLMAYAFTKPLQRLAQKVGFTVRVTPYAFRREFVTAVGRNGGMEFGKELATHTPHRTDSYGAYDFGFGDLNVTEIRLAEGGDHSILGQARNQARALMAAPSIRYRDVFDDSKRKAYFVEMLAADEDVQAFNDALIDIIKTLDSRLGLGTNLARRNFASDFSNSLANLGMEPFDISEIESYNVLQWSQLVVHVEPRQAFSFFKSFTFARTSYLAQRRKHCNAAYVAQWRAQAANPTNAEIHKRLAETKRPPQSIAGYTAPHKVSGQASHRPRGEDLEDSLESDAENDNQPDMNMMEPLPNVQLDINKVNESFDPLSLDEDYGQLDALRESCLDDQILSAGGSIALSAPGELPEDDADSNYESIRSALIQQWLDAVDYPRDKQTCALCQADLLWQPVKKKRTKPVNRSTTYESSVFHEHIRGNKSPHSLHSRFNAYMEFCKTEKGYLCRVCMENPRRRKNFNGDFTSSKLNDNQITTHFRRHLRTKHPNFCDRLMGQATVMDASSSTTR